MKHAYKLFIYLSCTMVLLDSCSITRTRYNRGLHIEFPWSGSGAEQPVAKSPKNESAWKQKDIPGSEISPSLSTSSIPVDSLIKPSTTTKAHRPYVPKKVSEAAPRFSRSLHNIQLRETPLVHRNHEAPSRSGGFGIAGFVLSFFAWYWPIGIIAIVFSAIGLSGGRPYKGLALAGLIIGILFFIGGLAYI